MEICAPGAGLFSRWPKVYPAELPPGSRMRILDGFGFKRTTSSLEALARVAAYEVDIHLNPGIGREWMLLGQQEIVLTPGRNQKACIAGAYDPRTRRIVCVDGDREGVWLFLNLFRTPFRGLYLIALNALS